MNFPMDRPIFQFLYWLVNTPGNGGVTVGLLALLVIVTVMLTLRWIATAEADERDVYAYPTPALHHPSQPQRSRYSLRR